MHYGYELVLTSYNSYCEINLTRKKPSRIGASPQLFPANGSVGLTTAVMTSTLIRKPVTTAGLILRLSLILENPCAGPSKSRAGRRCTNLVGFLWICIGHVGCRQKKCFFKNFLSRKMFGKASLIYVENSLPDNIALQLLQESL